MAIQTVEPVDCRGLACPEPVLRVREALSDLGDGVLTVLLDSAASRENVKRFAESQGDLVTVQEDGGGWRLTISRGTSCCSVPTAAPAGAGTAFLVTSDQIGPEPELGRILMRAFLGTLGKATDRPRKFLFVNRGVFLTTEGSEVIPILAELEAGGAEVLSCGTCLEFFGRREGLRVGKVSNMYETVETLTGPLRVVTVG